MSSSDWDGLAAFVWLGLFFAGVILVFVLGLFLIPVVLVAAGILFYFNNHYLPAQREIQAQKRTATMLTAAERIAPRDEQFIERVVAAGIEDDTLLKLAGELYRLEGLAPPPAPPPVADTIEGGRYRDQLMKYIETAQSGRFDEFMSEVVRILKREQRPAGQGMFSGRGRRTATEIEELIMQFFNTDHCFRELRSILDNNFNEQDGTMPSKYTGDNCAWDYLKDTPLLELEYIDRRADLTHRTSHTMVLGGSGSGKTNLLSYVIGQDLQRDDCTVVVIDSQVQLIPELANLELPADEVTYLNPTWNIGLNLFDVGYQELKARADAETAVNKAVGLIRFVLESTLTTVMTDRQRTMFDYAIQLIIAIPGGNILTFVELLKEGGHRAYEAEISQFDEVTRDFFMNDWGSADYRKTREAVRAKLMALLKNPTFKRLFATTENNFRMYDELQDRRLVLLDTNKPLLDKEASSFLGRLYVTMIVQAAYRRFDNRDKEYRTVYVVVDEAHEYLGGSRLAEVLEQARKASLGLTLSFQTLSQIRREGLDPATVIGNTATKLVSTSLPDDAAAMAKAMRIKADEILDLPQYTFALYNREQGMVPVRAPAHPLTAFEYRTDKGALKVAAEARYQAKPARFRDPEPEPIRPTGSADVPPPETAAPFQKKKKRPTAGSQPPTPPDDFDLDDVKPI